MENIYDDYLNLIIKYGWIEKDEQSTQFHFFGPDATLPVDGKSLNLLVKDTLYQENRMSSYVLEEVEDRLYLSFAGVHYKIVSLIEDESASFATMVLDLINSKGQIRIRKTYLGFIGNTN